MIHSEVLRDFARLEETAEAWEQLLTRSHNNEPMLSPLWLLSWWRVFGGEAGRQLRVLLVREDSELVGIVPLLARRHTYRPGIPFRRLELLASGEPEADEILSEYIGPIAVRGKERQVAAELVRALRARDLGPWDELVCPRMSTASPMTTELRDALQRSGLNATAIPDGVCHFVNLPPSWEQYLQSLSSRHRYTARRSLRDLKAWAGDEFSVRIAETEAELTEGRAVLESLHRVRWREGGHSGAFASGRFSDFHDQVMGGLLARGSLQLAWLMARGKPIAAAYNIVWNGTVYFYQSGRAIDLPKRLRPGIALHALLIAESIEQGHRCYDFLRGDAQYKKQLATNSRGLVEVRAHRKRSLLEVARRATERGIHGARAVRRRVEQSGR